ncbi:hypothetical protein L596_012532 [Steinernema carpocapsae]|uniref:Uncharacterized protein n=1 Tax=Steinernema carpocapsae TaxID=34508 RepID=A0A4U5NY84_STECR|nr:hypothetical protein L596_012532 [Steinernema carpocapsae]
MDSLPSEFADDVKTLIAKEVLQMDLWEHRGGKTSQMFAKKLLILNVVPVSDTHCFYGLQDGNEDLELCQPTWDAYRVSEIIVNWNIGLEKGLEMDSKEFRILRNLISKSLRPIDIYILTSSYIVGPVIMSLLNSVPRFSRIYAECRFSISELLCKSVRAQALSQLMLCSCNITDDFLSCLQTFIENCNFSYITLEEKPRVLRGGKSKLVDLLQEKALDFARKGKFVVLRVGRSGSKFWEGVEYYYEEKGTLLKLYVSPTLDKWGLMLPASTEKREF